jgi:hypothetical protein
MLHLRSQPKYAALQHEISFGISAAPGLVVHRVLTAFSTTYACSGESLRQATEL